MAPRARKTQEPKVEPSNGKFIALGVIVLVLALVSQQHILGGYWSNVISRVCGSSRVPLVPIAISAVQPDPTLVIYVYSATDPEYENNLKFFIREGIKANDGCDYIIVIQEDKNLQPPKNLPKLPPNARIITHPNECYDLGTIGWVITDVLGSTTVLERYKYIIWLNSSVRGPFMPGYMRNALHWTLPLTSKINDDVKLVGATINCGAAYQYDPYPHVQSYLSATDSTGLEMLLKAETVFKCYTDFSDVVVDGEIGASEVLLTQGYNLDSLMMRYQGIDWRDDKSTDGENPCNGGLNPTMPDFNDGVSVHPLEVMFVKVKAAFLQGRFRSAIAAATMDDWLYINSDAATQKERDELFVRNKWGDDLGLAKASEVVKYGFECFDWDFYLTANANDFGFLRDEEDPAMAAWNQFLQLGFYEGRPYRWTC